MDRSAATLLEFVSRLAYNVDGLSGKLKLYLSQFLTFHFSKTLSTNQIQEIENRKASKSFGSEDEIAAAATDLTEAEKCWTIASIELLHAESERLDDRVVSRRLTTLINNLTRILKLEGAYDLIATQRKDIEEEIRKYEERPVVRIPARIWPLSLDFVLRCGILFYFSLKGFDKSLLAGLNTSVIPLIVITLVIIYSRRNKKANFRLLESHGGIDRYKIEYNVSATQYTWLAFYLVVSTFISYLLPDQLHAFAFFGLALYYFIYLRFFSLGRISENDLVRQLDEKEQRTDTLDVDENDEMIVSLETRLNASTSRLDAYVLESALFGALSFSGFLQIMASDLISFTDLENFAANLFATSQALIHLDWAAFNHGLALLNNKVSLFCLVSVESLVCSIFFLAVIASRLRFSDIADKVRTSINLARAFNEKEEALYHESETNDVRQSRLRALTSKVNRQLFEASQSLRRVDPVMAYMEYFRNAGILVFLIILISSSLFITSVLGWTFLALVGATYFYFNREPINLNVKVLLLQLRIAFLKRSLWFLLLGIIPFVVAMVLRNSFFWFETQSLDAFGYLMIGLYLSVWLLLASHYDEEFGDIEKKENHRRQSRWNLVRNSLAAMIFLFFAGMAFKQWHLTGADEMLMIGASALAPLMFFAGYYLSRIKWIGVMSGWLMSTATIGLMFRILHLNGSREMLLIGTVATFVFSVVILWKRSLFHSLYLRFCLVLMFTAFTLLTDIYLRLELAYAHRTVDVAPLMKIYDDHQGAYYPTKEELSKALGTTEWYMTTYGKAVPYPAVYGDLVRMYNKFGKEIVWQADHWKEIDTTLLSNALIAVRERDKILALYDNPLPIVSRLDMTLEPDLLLRLNRKEEAIDAVNILLQRLDQMDEQRKELADKLASISAL